MPIAVRATSGHSVNLRVDLKPELIMRKLTLKTAWTLKGAYHVTSPSHLMSILKHGIVPGGEKQRRLMTFFGVFPPWVERNRVTRTRSPDEGDMHMLIIYIPPTELEPVSRALGISWCQKTYLLLKSGKSGWQESAQANQTTELGKGDGSSPDLSRFSRSNLPMRLLHMQTSRLSEDLESLPQDFKSSTMPSGLLKDFQNLPSETLKIAKNSRKILRQYQQMM